jgi:hypothetical protein
VAGRVAGERLWRGRGDASASARLPVNGGEIQVHTQSRELPWVLGKALGRLAGGGSGRTGVLTVGALMAGDGAGVRTRGGSAALL